MACVWVGGLSEGSSVVGPAMSFVVVRWSGVFSVWVLGVGLPVLVGVCGFLRVLVVENFGLIRFLAVVVVLGL